MTLLSICQQIARETGVAVPSTIVGNNSLDAKLLLAAAQTEGNTLAKGIVRNIRGVIVGKHDWSELRKEHTFTTSASDEDYSLPSDFARFIGDTWWNRNNNTELKLVSPERWQYLKSGNVGSTGIRIEFIKRGSLIYLYPTPSSAQTLAFEYLSKNWCQSSGGTEQSAWAADTDTGILDEELITLGVKYRFLKARGAPYAEEKAEYEDRVRDAMASDGGRTAKRLGGDYIVPNANIPEEGYGS